MTVWQYAQLRVTYDDRLAAGDNRWIFAWLGPDAATRDVAGSYDEVVAELNRVGAEGWELFDVATLDAGDTGRFPDQKDWSLTQYTFRRPRDRAVVKSSELIQQGESASFQPVQAGQLGVQDDLLAGSRSVGPTAVIRFTIHWQRDGEGADIAMQDRGVLLVRRQAARLPSRAEVDKIQSLHAQHQTSDVSKERREEIKDLQLWRLLRCEVESGLGQEAVDEAGPVLHRFEPGLDQHDQLAGALLGEIGEGSLQVRPDCLSRFAIVHGSLDRRLLARRLSAGRGCCGWWSGLSGCGHAVQGDKGCRGRCGRGHLLQMTAVTTVSEGELWRSFPEVTRNDILGLLGMLLERWAVSAGLAAEGIGGERDASA